MQLLKETQVPIRRDEEHGEACRLRIRTQRHGEHLHVRRTAVGLSAGDARRERGPKSTGRSKSPNCWTRVMRIRREVTLVCDNLNTHTKGAFYEAFPPETSPRVRATDQLLLHAQTRQLAERRRMRIELPDEPMPERPPHRRHRRAAIGNRHLGRQEPTPNNGASTGNSESRTPASN